MRKTMCATEHSLLILELEVGIDVNNTEALVVVWDLVKNGGYISDKRWRSQPCSRCFVAMSAVTAKGAGHVEL